MRRYGQERISGIATKDLLDGKGFSFQVMHDVDEENGYDSDDDGSKKEPFPRAHASLFSEANLKNVTFGVSQEDMCQSFDEVAAVMDDMEYPGMKKKVVRPGNGTKPPMGSKVFVNYSIILEGHDEPLDTNTLTNKNKEFCFKLGEREVLPVLDYGVGSMEVKEISKFIAISDYAFGELGCLDRVPPKSTVLVVIELVYFLEPGAVATIQDIYDMNEEERNAIPYSDFLKEADALKVAANENFLYGDIEGALKKYKRALLLLDMKIACVADETRDRDNLLFLLNMNMAQCKINTGKYQRAIMYLKDAERVPNFEQLSKEKIGKLYYRYAVSYFELGKTDKATEMCEKAKVYNSNAITDICKKIELRKKEEEVDLAKMAKRMFSNCSLNEKEEQEQEQ